MMRIEHITWLSQDAEEALLMIRDNSYSCEVFCQPCTYQTGDTIKNPLISFEEGNVVRVFDAAISIRKNGENFSHEVVAKVIDFDKRLVAVGDIMIELSLPLPKDIKNGEKVLFYPDRLDAM